MNEIKFRAWDIEAKKMRHIITDIHWALHGITGCKYILNEIDGGTLINDADCVGGKDRFILMQYIGLKDKNGNLTEIYERDIIGENGLVKGNKYDDPDLLKDKTNLLIEGFGTKDWFTTYKKAVDRGCSDAK